MRKVEIREAVWREVSAQPWARSFSHKNVIVRDGVAHLWGFISSEEERKALVVATRNISGVTDVADHLEYRIPEVW